MKDMLNKAKKPLKNEITVDSAAATREELGADMYPHAKTCLDHHGIPYSFRRARIMTAADYDKYDYIIGMDDNNMRQILRICGSDPDHKITKLLDWAGIDRSIADPWYTGNFELTYQDIVTGCTALLEAINK